MKRLLWSLSVLGALTLVGRSYKPPAPLSAEDLWAITTVIQRENSMPLRSIRPERGDRAVVYLSDGRLGRMEFKLSRQNEGWRIVATTCCF